MEINSGTRIAAMDMVTPSKVFRPDTRLDEGEMRE